MQRNLMQELLSWRSHPLRKPLIIRGARQVGKSYLVAEFGQTFANCVTLNFERDPKAKGLFEGSKDPLNLISSIAAYTDQKIIPGETLLFFDEAQECEGALQSLRYFKEELPQLHVIAAGSLLDFALEHIGLPVGRVQFMYLHPFSFEEYLIAIGKNELCQYAKAQEMPLPLHEKLLEEIRHYAWLGGMPAVVDAWRQYRDPHMCQALQDQILQAYRQDFEKYAKKHQIPVINKLFDQIGIQLGQKFKYSKIDNTIRSQVLKEALHLLCKAGVVNLAYHTSAQGLPLSATIDLQKFKAFFFDMGLLQRLQGLNLKEWLLAPLSVTYMGAMAEQWVAQEYIANTSITEPPALFYWQREAKQSNAEVDFVFSQDARVIPVEVKSGSKGRLKSLSLFLEGHPTCKEGLVISEKPAWRHEELVGIPFYALASWLKSAYSQTA